MRAKTVRNDRFNNDWYDPGASGLVRALWFLLNAFFMQARWNPWSGGKVWLLRRFGAKVGQGVVIKPSVNIKYPWKLEIGDHSWIGEGVWIDNLACVEIGRHVCLSQGAMLLCGNHNYKKENFDLIAAPITLEDGVWIGARAVVCPGLRCRSHAVLSVGSVATSDLEAYSVYGGVPAQYLRQRSIE